jgi:integrase
MPALQRGSAYKLASGRGWGVRWRDKAGKRHHRSPFPSKSTALRYYRDEVAGRDGSPTQAITLAEFVPVYLERHGATVRSRTVLTLSERLHHAVRAYGDVPLRDLEAMAGELASWQASLPERSRYGIVQALRQTFGGAVRWGYMASNPALLAGRNRQPPPREIRVYTLAEVEAVADELSPPYRTLPVFVAATGVRPEEWQALERRDIDHQAGLVTVVRTASGGEVVALGKTAGARRQVPLSRRALGALDAIPPRLDTPLLFPAPAGGLLNLDNWRRREWAPAVEAAGVRRPARIYDLRSTFASDALAAGVSVFEVARIMGTSVRMIERHYGALLDGAGAGIAGRLDAHDAEREVANKAGESRQGGSP